MKRKFIKSLILPIALLISESYVCTTVIKKAITNTNIDLGSTEIYLDETAYSSIGFYFDIELNDRPCDILDGGAWDSSHLLMSETGVVQRYSSSTGQITTRSYPFFKLTESHCWMSLNEADLNDIFFIYGTFSDTNGYSIDIKPIYVKIVEKTSSGVKVSSDTPKVSLSSSTCEINKNTIKAYENNAPSDLSFSVDKGTINVSYSSGAVNSSYFTRRTNETVSNHTVNVEVTYNHFTYTNYYSLLVGLHDFSMTGGASVSIDGDSSCELRFIATVPHFNYTKFSISDAKFIVTTKESLRGKELNYDNVFGASRVFTFDPSESNKYLINQSKHVSASVDSNGNCTIIGSVKGILKADYLTQYVGLCYFENSTIGKAVASFENNDQLTSTRSPYQVATLAYDNGNTSLYDKFIASQSTKSVNAYIRCLNSDLNNEVISISQTSGNLFTEVNAPDINGMKCSIKKHRISGDGNYLDFYYTKDYGSEFDVYAWDTPALTSDNNFDNDYTAAVAETMKAAGITVAILSGHSYKPIYNDGNISYFKYIIKAFYKHGIKTAIQIGGAVNDDRHYYGSAPDFSMCPGFYGYLEWDEPAIDKIPGNLTNYAKMFNETYKGTDHKFIVNLNPSQASTSIVSSNFTDYIQSYCTNILNNLDVQHRYLSIDNYPFSADTSFIRENTLLDMALATLYGHEYQATTSFCLQSCGWDDTCGSVDDYMRAPSAGEMKMMVYNALCFGFDTISWFTYSANAGHYQDASTNGGQYVTPVNRDNTINTEIYNGLQSANTRWKEGKTLLKDYSYRGTYVYSQGKIYSAAKAFTQVLNNSTWTIDRNDRYYISNITSLSNTLFSSVSSTRSYLIGVYQKANGEQAYVINNYVSKSTGSTTIKIKMNTNVVVTQDGSDESLSSGTTKSYTINQGSGLIVRKA